MKKEHVVSSSQAEVPFRENADRHAAELRAAGATPDHLARLEAAAQRVEAAAAEDDAFRMDLALALAPYRTSMGLMIQPPTNAARFWARQALVRASNGSLPPSATAQTIALVAGLVVLRLWGDGHHDQAMHAVTSADTLPDLIHQEVGAADVLDANAVARDWLILMGISPEKKAEALGEYEAILQELMPSRSAATTPA